MDKSIVDIVYHIPPIEISSVLEYIYNTVFTTGREDELENTRKKFNDETNKLADRLTGKTREQVEQEARNTAIKIMDILLEDKAVSLEELKTLILAQLIKSRRSINLKGDEVELIKKAIEKCKDDLCGKNVFFRIYNETKGVIELRAEDLCMEAYDNEDPKKRKRYRDARITNQKERENKWQEFMGLEENEIMEDTTILDVLGLLKFEDLFKIYKESKVNYKNQYLQLAKHLMELDPELPEDDKSAKTYNEVLKGASENKYFPQAVLQVIKDDIDYINVDMIFLLAAFRGFEELIVKDKEEWDNLGPDEKSFEFYYDIVKKSSKILEERKSKQSFLVSDGEGEQGRYNLSYVKKQLKKAIPEKHLYIRESTIEDNKERLFNGEISFKDIDSDVLKFIELSEKELEKLAAINFENLKYILINNKLPIEKIRSIVFDYGFISAEDISFLLENRVIDKENIKMLLTMGKINVNIAHKYLEEDDVANMFSNGEISVDDLLEFYQRGKIDSETLGIFVTEYALEQEVLDGFNDDKISYKQACELFENGAIDQSVSGYLYRRYITPDEDSKYYSFEPLFWGIETGIISEGQIEGLYSRYEVFTQEDIHEAALDGKFSFETIKKLYLNSIISLDIIENLKDHGIITEKQLEEAKRELNISKIESSYPFNGKIEIISLDQRVELPEKVKIENDGEGDSKPTKKGKGFDPRYKIYVLQNLGYEVSQIDSNSLLYDKDNPFYHYEFFIVRYEDGSFDENSPVIAERLYKNREKRTSWAYGDATYILKLQDFKVVGKQGKTALNNFMKKGNDKEEVESDKFNKYQGVVRANHKLEKTWANKVNKAVREMMGKGKESIYSEEELALIDAMPIVDGQTKTQEEPEDK